MASAVGEPYSITNTLFRSWVWEWSEFNIQHLIGVFMVQQIQRLKAFMLLLTAHWEPRGNMKINLPVFKVEDTKDAVTYQSWHWDITVYCCTGCWGHTLLPYVICSLQGYPGELVWSLGMNVMLDDILTILDEHYNNVKALDALNQELFQLRMGEKETVSDWGICLSRHLQVLEPHFLTGFCQTEWPN